MTRLTPVLLSGFLALSLLAAPIAAEDPPDGEGVTDLGTNHPLAANPTNNAYQRTGYVSGDLTRYRITLEAAEAGSDVGLGPSITRDMRNDYLRIQYNESASRTLRILLPREYITPYTMESVGAIGSDHHASYQPARSGEYLAVTIMFDGPGDVVLPLQKDSSAGGALVETVDRRVKALTGISPLGRNGKWQYLDGEAVANEPAYPLNTTSEDVLIQYDARPEEPNEVWLNAPRGEQNDVPLYYFKRDRDDQLYIVSADNSTPDVRYKTEPSRTDRIRGDLNDIRLVPDRIRDGVGGVWPF
jgi:hypothetical protein